MDSSDSFKKPSGYNPMRWDCSKSGCFNLEMRPKIEVFCDCFPGKINFGDVDGIVEINGKALMLEWKSKTEKIPIAQEIMFQRITRSGMIVVLCVFGNAKTMEVKSFGYYSRGIRGFFRDGDLLDVKAFIRKFVLNAQGEKR